MKKILFLTLLLAVNYVFASKSRVQALASSYHLLDPQFFSANPVQAHAFGNFFLVESGLTTSTNTVNNAEAMISYGLENDSRIVVGFGKNDDSVMLGRTFINGVLASSTFEVPQNMLQVIYGFKADGVAHSIGWSYSNKNDIVAGTKESSAGLTWGMKKGDLVVFSNLGLINHVVAAAGKKFNGNGYFRLSSRYKVESLLYGFDFQNWSAKSQTSGVVDESYDVQTIRLGVVKSAKNDISEVFVGGQLVSNSVQCKTKASVSCTAKFNRLSLPVWIGVETQALDWLIIRGSVNQSVLLDTSKDDIGLAAATGVAGANGAVSDFNSGRNTTSVRAGVGFKLNKVLIDANWTGAATTQNFNTTDMFSQVAMTYNF